MEKLVRVRNGSFWRMVAFSVVMLVLFLGSILMFGDGSMLGFSFLFFCMVCVRIGWYFVLSPSEVIKEEDGYYNVKIAFFSNYLSCKDLGVDEETGAAYITLSRKVGSFSFHFDQDKMGKSRTSIINWFKSDYMVKYLVGRDYMYVGNGDPKKFFEGQPKKEA